MLLNTDMTRYTKTFNTTTRLEEWTKEYYPKVFWTGGVGANLNKGLTEANSVKVRVPLPATFKVGDLIVKGNGNDIDKQSDLKDGFVITSVIDNSYAKIRPHIHIEGK